MNQGRAGTRLFEISGMVILHSIEVLFIQFCRDLKWVGFKFVLIRKLRSLFFLAHPLFFLPEPKNLPIFYRAKMSGNQLEKAGTKTYKSPQPTRTKTNVGYKFLSTFWGDSRATAAAV